MANQAAMLQSNVSVEAANILAKANALMNAHGVMAELTFTVRELRPFSTKQIGKNTVRIPTAIKFTLIDDEAELVC